MSVYSGAVGADPKGSAQAVPFVDLRAQFQVLREEVLPAMVGVLEDASFIMGPQLAAFERAFAAYVGAAECVGVESGTGALVVGLRALGVGPGDEVIMPANTYIASALAVSAVGAKPVFVDTDESYLIDARAIESAINSKTRAIMPVHLYGRVVPMQPVLDIAQRFDLKVIEDASQAHGARWDGRPAGSFGDIGCFSFYPGKNLGAYGDGGAVVTSNPAYADFVRLYRDFGQREKYKHSMKGDNCRLDTLQAAVLSVKLGHLDEWNARRRRAARWYDERLSGLGITATKPSRDEEHVYHLYVVQVDGRQAVQDALKRGGIQTGIHYPIPVHLQPAYSDLGLARGAFPRTEAAADRVLSLPMFPEIEEAQVDRVADELRHALRDH